MNRVEIKGTVILHASAKLLPGGSLNYATLDVNGQAIEELLATSLCKGGTPDEERRVKVDGIARVHIVIEPMEPLDVQVDRPPAKGGAETLRQLITGLGAAKLAEAELSPTDE